MVQGVPYLTSLAGIFNIIEWVSSLIGFLCIVTNGNKYPLLYAYIAGTAIALTVSTVVLLMNVVVKVSFKQSFLTYFYLSWLLYMLVVSSLILYIANNGQYIAGGTFGIILAGAYFVEGIQGFYSDPPPPFRR